MTDACTAAESTLSKAQADYNTAKASPAGKPRIAISTSPVIVDKVEQPNQIRIGVRTENERGFAAAVPRIRIHGYDVGHDGITDMRSASTKLASNLVGINYTYPSGASGLVAPTNINGTYKTANPDGDPATIVGEPPGTTPVLAKNACERDDAEGTAMAFPPADWDYPFWEQSAFSFNFKPIPSYTWDSANASWTPPPANAAWKWPVQSIVDNCYIEATAELVTGFFTCRNLYIRGGRTKPLRVIGTFLVGRAHIARQAVDMGILWSSIFHPQAAVELEKAGRLGRGLPAGASCGQLANSFPIWHPDLPLPLVATIFSCSVNSLRTADPFKWTHLSDCGIVGTNNGTSCSNHDLRHNTSTVSSITNVMQ